MAGEWCAYIRADLLKDMFVRPVLPSLLLGLAVSAFYLAMSLPMAHLARLLERRLRDRATERVVETEVATA